MTRFASKKLIAGNWKMNGVGQEGEFRALVEGLRAEPPKHHVWLFPPATLLADFSKADLSNLSGANLSGADLSGVVDESIWLGGQDCHPEAHGPYTGDISASLLGAAGAKAVIVGHSERRLGYKETDALVRAKAEAALKAGLEVIVCVGEEAQHTGQRDVIARQLAGSLPSEPVVVAYEPIWAIGTGHTPSLDEMRAMHAHISTLTPAGTRVLYGGSVTPDNAAEILALPEVGGVLVGGASLNAKDFMAIIRSA